MQYEGEELEKNVFYTGAAPNQQAIPAVEYLFNEEGTPLPDLGGIQTSLSKRTRHRRALVRLLFDYFESNRMIVCIDPSSEPY